MEQKLLWFYLCVFLHSFSFCPTFNIYVSSNNGQFFWWVEFLWKWLLTFGWAVFWKIKFCNIWTLQHVCLKCNARKYQDNVLISFLLNLNIADTLFEYFTFDFEQIYFTLYKTNYFYLHYQWKHVRNELVQLTRCEMRF